MHISPCLPPPSGYLLSCQRLRTRLHRLPANSSITSASLGTCLHRPPSSLTWLCTETTEEYTMVVCFQNIFIQAAHGEDFVYDGVPPSSRYFLACQPAPWHTRLHRLAIPASSTGQFQQLLVSMPPHPPSGRLLFCQPAPWHTHQHRLPASPTRHSPNKLPHNTQDNTSPLRFIFGADFPQNEESTNDQNVGLFFVAADSSHCLFVLFLSLSRCNADSVPLARLFSPLSTVRAFVFIARRVSTVSPLVDSYRLVLTHALKRSRQLVSPENKILHTEV